MRRYPIYRDFDQKHVIGWVLLDDETFFTASDILAPEVVVDYEDPIKGTKTPVIMIGFGLIKGKKYLPNPVNSIKKEFNKIKNKNANI